jgi:heme exporter protein C
MNWSNIGKNSIIVGVFFVAFTLITGSLWFNATSGGYNNIYWQWSDPRQTTTLILLLSYIAYLIFRNFIEDREKKAKLSAILGIVFFPTVPLSYFSAIIFTSFHPLINPNPGEPGNIYWDTIKMFSLFFNLIAITFLFIYLVRELNELDLAKQKLQELLQTKMEDAK